MAFLLEKEQIEQARQLIDGAQRIVIVTHMAPDGDAMGSALAMCHWCKGLPVTGDGLREVTVIVPNAFPAFYNWMPGADQIKVYEGHAHACDPLLAQADLFVCTDFNDPKRIGPVGEKMMMNSCPKILIDHHLNPTDFANVVFSYPDACSSCEIVYRLIKAVSQVRPASAVSLQIATSIYTGLMTDTGNFAFNSTSADLYDIIADLLRAGVQKDAIYDAVFNQYSIDRLRMTGFALYRKMRIYPEHHLALITLSADELELYHYKTGDTEGLVNMPLQISDIYYSVFMREERPKPGTPKPRIRVSFRSQGDRPVNVWASEVFHGGGHANASGGELFGTLAQAVALLEKTYKKYIV
ncbi:MAG: DHH family phosphoesterase [Paludibacteraceae bacterium]|nr:DHH family phosphoesterase [Paludibacteraceae bacterium]